MREYIYKMFYPTVEYAKIEELLVEIFNSLPEIKRDNWQRYFKHTIDSLSFLKFPSRWKNIKFFIKDLFVEWVASEDAVTIQEFLRNIPEEKKEWEKDILQAKKEMLYECVRTEKERIKSEEEYIDKNELIYLNTIYDEAFHAQSLDDMFNIENELFEHFNDSNCRVL